MRLLACKLAKRSELQNYLRTCVVDATRAREYSDLLFPRAVFSSAINHIRGLRRFSNGETITVSIAEFDTVLAEAEAKREDLPREPPGMTFKFNDGWMRELDNPSLWLFKKEQTREATRVLIEHLADNLPVNSLPVLCSGDCDCVVQQSGVGECGGLPRRVPCARTELENEKPMTLTTIKYVSFHYALRLND